MSGSNCCFLTNIQVSQETGNMVWYSHLFENFPQFVVIHTVKGFSIVNEADVFLEFPCFFYDPTVVGNLISGSSAFSKSSLYIWTFLVHILLKPILKDFVHYLASMWNEHKFGKLSTGHRTGKDPFSFQSQWKAMPKNVQTAVQLHSFHFYLVPKVIHTLTKTSENRNMQKRDLNNSHNPTWRPFLLTRGAGTQGKGALGQQLCDLNRPPSQSLTSSIHKAASQWLSQ